MVEFKFEKFEKELISAKVYDHIKQGVLMGALIPGTRLLETQIAEQMGVSRSPVREAMRHLEAEGVVETVANQGTFVRELTYNDVREIYTARALIEGYAASLAAERTTKNDIKGLEKAKRKAIEAARQEDFQKTLVADFDLHRMIWEIAGHKLLFQILTRLEVQIRMFIAVQAPLFRVLIDSVQDHQEIVQAISEGNGQKAKTAMENHISNAGTLILNHLQTQNEFESEALATTKG